MKKVKAVLTLILIVALSASAFAQAATLTGTGQLAQKLNNESGEKEELLIDRAKKGYLHSLNSDNEGIVESALFYVLKFKLTYPGLDVSEIGERINEVAQNGDTPEIRYKAYIAVNYLNNPDWLINVNYLKYVHTLKGWAKRQS